MAFTLIQPVVPVDGPPPERVPAGDIPADATVAGLWMAIARGSSSSSGAGNPAVTTGKPKVASAPKRTPPKMSIESAWAAWEANCTASSGSEFLQSVASWTEGSAAQLLRQRWPAGFKRPTASEVQERLRHNLGLAVRGGHSTYREALGWTRQAVIDDLRRAQQPSGMSDVDPSAPR